MLRGQFMRTIVSRDGRRLVETPEHHSDYRDDGNVHAHDSLLVLSNDSGKRIGEPAHPCVRIRGSVYGRIRNGLRRLTNGV